MKALIAVLVLLNLNVSFASENQKRIPFPTGKVATAGVVSFAIIAEQTGGYFFGATGLTAAAGAGYLVGSIIVKADKTFFKGSLVSKTGELLGPINRRIYNMTHEDELPEVIVTKDGTYKILNAQPKSAN